MARAGRCPQPRRRIHRLGLREQGRGPASRAEECLRRTPRKPLGPGHHPVPPGSLHGADRARRRAHELRRSPTSRSARRHPDARLPSRGCRARPVPNEQACLARHRRPVPGLPALNQDECATTSAPYYSYYSIPKILSQQYTIVSNLLQGSAISNSLFFRTGNYHLTILNT